MKSLTQRMNDLIGGVEKKKDAVVSDVKAIGTRVKRNITEDQTALRTGKVGRYESTNPFRK